MNKLDVAPIIEWQNQDNNDFYNRISLDWFMQLNKKLGLNMGCDLDLIMPYIANANSILELGASYGRVIEHLLLRGYRDKITAVERSPQFYNRLVTLFSNRVEILNYDMRFMNLKSKFDLILWLWSGICDFAKDEQLHVLLNAKKHLNSHSYLIMDTLHTSVTPIIAKTSNEQAHILQGSNNTILNVYIPSIKEVGVYAKKLNLSFKYIKYATKSGSNRVMYILGN